MTNYIFIGPPGSGKGTQAKMLAKKINGYYFGMGDILRSEAKSGSKLGQKFQEVWDRKDGGLLPTQLVDELFEQKISSIEKTKPIIFDGYPRRLSEIKVFEKLFNNSSNKAININVENNELMLRMSTRKVCPNCGKVFFRADLSGITTCDNCDSKLITRQEDEPEVIRKRINVYNSETKPLIGYYRNKNMIIDIDGNPPIEDVKNEIWNKLNV